jgi:hypothetical protein
VPPHRRPTTPLSQLFRSVLFRTKVVDATVGSFVGLIGMAMLLYRGGTWWDVQRQGHSFWENFLCDLLHRQTLGGQPNVVGSRLALTGMLVLVVGIVAAFSLVPELIPSRRPLGRSIAWFGSIGSLGLALAPLLPSDSHPLLHSIAVVVGGLPAIIGLLALVGALLLEPLATRELRGVSLLLLVLVVIAMALYAWTALLHGPSLRYLPGIERLANLTLLVWLLMLTRLVRYRLFVTYIALAKRAQAASS